MPLEVIAVIIFFGLFLMLRVPTGNTLEINAERSDNDFQAEKSSVFIGKNETQKIYIPFDTSHVYICGTTGSGKTVALANFIDAVTKNDLPMLIVDGKGDTGRDSIFDLTKRLKGGKKLYVINMNDPKNSHKYNPFQNTSSTVIKDMMINLTEWSEEHYKANVERYLQRVIDLMILDSQYLSFKSIVHNMSISHYEELSAKLVKSEIITKENHSENMEISKESGKIAQGSVARFSQIIESELGGIFDNEGIDIFTALQEKAIILFVLNPLSYPVLSALIGNLVIIDAKKAVAKIYGGNLGRVFFVFDEVNVYISNNVLDLVNKARSAKVTCVLASQSLSDLEAVSPTLKAGVIENCNNYIVMRQNYHSNAEEWANIIGTNSTVEVTYQLQSKAGNTNNTGSGSARIVREYIYHPDEIKALERGNAFLISKEFGSKEKIHVRKPF